MSHSSLTSEVLQEFFYKYIAAYLCLLECNSCSKVPSERPKTRWRLPNPSNSLLAAHLKCSSPLHLCIFFVTHKATSLIVFPAKPLSNAFIQVWLECKIVNPGLWALFVPFFFYFSFPLFTFLHFHKNKVFYKRPKIPAAFFFFMLLCARFCHHIWSRHLFDQLCEHTLILVSTKLLFFFLGQIASKSNVT